MSYGGLDIASDSVDAARTGADTFPSFGISAYYNYYWNEEFSSTVGCLMTDLDTTDGMAETNLKQVRLPGATCCNTPGIMSRWELSSAGVSERIFMAIPVQAIANSSRRKSASTSLT